jgi:hypothetical protein
MKLSTEAIKKCIGHVDGSDFASQQDAINAEKELVALIEVKSGETMKLPTELIRACIGDVMRLGVGNDEIIAQANEAFAELSALEANQILVRCKDCKEYKKNEDGILACHVHDGLQLLVNPNHYCGYGEAKK